MWKVVLGLAAAFLGLHDTYNPLRNPVSWSQERQCKRHSDLVILLDSSSNFSPTEFDKAKNSVADFALELRSAVGNRVGFRVFTVQPQTVVPLNNIYTQEQFEYFVKSALHFNQAQLYFNYSLIEASTELIKVSPRPVTRAVLLITAGKSLNPEATPIAANELLKSGIENYVVGISSKVSQSEIRSISGNDNSRTFFADTVESLPRILKSVTDSLCQTGVDVNILVDTSYRHKGYWTQVTNVISSFVGELADHANTRIGLREFGQNYSTSFTVKDKLSRNAMVKLAQNLSFWNSNFQNPEKAINAARRELSDAANGNKQFVVIFMSDLPPINATLSQAASNEARKLGITPMAVGLGSLVPEEVLEDLIGYHPNQFFRIRDYNYFQGDLEKILAAIYGN